MSHNASRRFSNIETFLNVHGLSKRPANARDSERMVASLYAKAGITSDTHPENNFMTALPGTDDLKLQIIRDKDQTQMLLSSPVEGYKVVINQRDGVYQPPAVLKLTENEIRMLKLINFGREGGIVMHAPYLTQEIRIHPARRHLRPNQ